MFKKIENQMDQVQVALSGAIERLSAAESRIKELQSSRLKKPVVYVDEETCLLSSTEADIKFIERKLEEI